MVRILSYANDKSLNLKQHPGPLYTKRADGLPQNLVQFRSHEISI